MANTTWPVYSPFAKEHFGKGKAEGKAEAVVAVLLARGVRVIAEQRTLIETTINPERLDRWINQAATATSMNDLF